MKNDAVMTLTLAALLSSQNIIEDPAIPDADRIAAVAQREELLQGLLAYAQRSQPESTANPKEQFGEWTSSLFVNFYDHTPNVEEFFTWLQDNPPPRDVPTRSIDAFLCNFFLETKSLAVQ